MLQLVQMTIPQVRTIELWIPPRRLNKMPCERCGLMAHYATWTVCGDGETRDAWLHIYCDYCQAHVNWVDAHALKIEAYEQRKAVARAQRYDEFMKVVGL